LIQPDQDSNPRSNTLEGAITIINTPPMLFIVLEHALDAKIKQN
jgi:hypothetical protein